jgi:hypothetical protein
VSCGQLIPKFGARCWETHVIFGEGIGNFRTNGCVKLVTPKRAKKINVNLMEENAKRIDIFCNSLFLLYFHILSYGANDRIGNWSIKKSCT